MMNKEARELLPLRLQFFASKGEDDDNIDDDVIDGTTKEGEGDDDDNIDDDDIDDDKSKKTPDKTFTQKEVTAMMTREKKEGRKSLLKQLGFKSESEAKQAIALYNALVDSQKSEEQKKEEANKGLEDAKTEAEKRAEAAENKLACVIAGVKKDSINDALAIASLKVTEEKNLDKVLAEMKNEARYAGFFGNDESDDTGKEPNHSKSKKESKKGTYGAQLAKGTQSAKKKSSYF